MVSIKLSLITAISLLGAVNAAPAHVAEHGVTNPISNGISTRDNVLQKRAFTCSTTSPCTAADVVGCIKKLRAIGNANCITGPFQEFEVCREGSCSFMGKNLAGPKRRVTCSDVASGAATLYNGCKVNSMVGGVADARGDNSAFEVTVALYKPMA
ncbi:hypothetical protein AOL_s00173g15 [Orbilia oligospora ATCC 24927]|uniref:Cyanovirin-N domain-containing protein n=1 Tax=Arthrobotrys oligospora (strain ATCC 24927 / CBS 115.81 / DSM 1491) TaxID=756982 RepID=G1XNJ7_ARTOA|nr:hypothetical protein AOL_s00173g15 [Orbilia oligospora ATCC 24927]EGX44914.1 hypothetical protein AOL_s00173g15 [Orbilia oligospora ATCC 24927]